MEETLAQLKKLSLVTDKKIKEQAMLTLAALDPSLGMGHIVESIASKDREMKEYAIVGAGVCGKGALAIQLADNIELWEKDISLSSLAAFSLSLLGKEKGSSILQQKLGIALGRSQARLDTLIKTMLLSLYLCGNPGDAAPISFLLEENKIVQPDVKGLAYWVSAGLDFTSVEKRLKKVLRKKGIRRFAIPALSFSRQIDAKTLQYIAKVASSRSEPEDLRIQAILALGRIGTRPSILKLRKLAKKLEPPLNYLVIVARAMTKDKDKGFIRLLEKGISKGTVPEERAACGLALGILALPGSGTALNKAIKKEKDYSAILGLLLGIGMTGEAAFAERVEEIFFSTLNPNLVKLSAGVLAVIDPGRDADERLHEGITKWKSHFLWKQRLRWSGLFGGEKTFLLMEKILKAPDLPPAVTVEAMRALRVLGDKRERPPALNVLFHPAIPFETQAMWKARRILWGD